MQKVTIALDDKVISHARVEAVQEGKSQSRFISELVENRVGRKKTQLEALRAFLSGPLMDLTDENGRAPTRDKTYD